MIQPHTASANANAIVYSTGRVSQTEMIRVGVVLNVICAALVFGLVFALCSIYGWT